MVEKVVKEVTFEVWGIQLETGILPNNGNIVNLPIRCRPLLC